MTLSRFNRNHWLALVLSTSVLLLLLELKLLPVLIAGLLVYVLVNRLTPLLKLKLLWGEGPRLLAVSLVAGVVIAAMVWIGMAGAALLRETNDSLPALLARMAEILEHSRQTLPEWTMDYLPADADQLRKLAVSGLREHAQFFQVAGTGIGRALVHIIIGLVLGGLLALEAATPVRRRRPLAAAIALRAHRLSVAFRRVVFAQAWISAINTLFTSVFIMVLLPEFGVQLPFVKTLIVVTFVAGLMPIIGNLISNTVIFVVSLSHSLIVALVVLCYLVLIHKLEYFLNARIVGAHIRARAWEMLLAMLVLESAFGIPGLIAAPTYYAYLKDELRSRGLV